MPSSVGRSAIVVGGGVGGLVAARDLALGGVRVTLIEASDRLGGKVASHEVAGVVLDAGAESFALRGDTVEKLVRELGLEVAHPLAESAWLKPAVGEPLPLPATSMLGIPGTPLAADVVAVIGQRAALRAQLDSLMLGQIGSNESTLGGLVRRRMGSAVVDRLVAPVVMGIHSKHPDELSVDAVAPSIRSTMQRTGGGLAYAVRTLREAAPPGSAVAGIAGGIHLLADKLASDFRNLRGEVLLNSRVAAADASGVTLAGGERLEADLVVLATPLEHDDSATIALVTLVVDTAALDGAPRGTGLLVAPGAEGIAAKALTHSSAKWPWLAAALPEHRHVIRLSYNPPFPEHPEETAREDAQALLGVPVPALVVRGRGVVTWPAVPQKGSIPEGVAAVGEWVAGTGLAAVISHARKEAGRLLGEVES